MRFFLTFVLAIFLGACSTQSKRLSQKHDNKTSSSIFPFFKSTSGAASKSSKREIASTSGRCPDLSGTFRGTDENGEYTTVSHYNPRFRTQTIKGTQGEREETVVVVYDGVLRTMTNHNGRQFDMVAYCREGVAYTVSGFRPDPIDPVEAKMSKGLYEQIKFRSTRKFSDEFEGFTLYTNEDSNGDLTHLLFYDSTEKVRRDQAKYYE